MTTEPIVSVVIPVYNGSNFLKYAIESALSQTYRKCEIIVINDGSDDQGITKKIAKGYGVKIKYAEQENRGMAAALNHGLRLMNGEYFVWLSHDDTLMPYKVEAQLEAIRKSGNEDTMEPIQVGSVLGDRIIANLRDDTGNNISYKNENYSELTALYWLWKNRLCGRGGENVYYGLMQYRRRLMIAKEDLYRLEANGVDAVLPYPMIYEPNISVHPKRYLRDNDLKNLLTALDEFQPLYAEAASTILLQPYFYNYNIILARKSVLADYCNWLFPILERVEELNAYNGTERADRYIGYMGELLETLYFMYHKEDLCLAHTGCKFYV